MNINTRRQSKTTSFVIMAHRVQQILPDLKRLYRMTPSERKKYIKSCNSKFIFDMCECVKNLLKGNVPLKTAHLKCLKQHKQSLRQLSLKHTSLKVRKKILQKGGFLGFLLPSLISGLVSLVGGLFTRNRDAEH
jgi:hypothetical protein